MSIDRRPRRLTHLDRHGRARMVDVGEKPETAREAVARGDVVLAPGTLRLITTGAARKGDVLGVAQVAGIAAAKRTWELIPLCHAIPLTGITVRLAPDPAASRVRIENIRLMRKSGGRSGDYARREHPQHRRGRGARRR